MVVKVFRRDFGDYNPKNKIEIDWDTGEPTGRDFTQYREQYIREMVVKLVLKIRNQ